MANITPGELWAWLLAAALAVTTLANAVEKIVKAWKAWKAPNDHQNERLNALEEWKREVDRKLNRDNDRLGDMEIGNRATMHALLALLDHGIDGNNIKQMQDAKEELQNHLINR